MATKKKPEATPGSKRFPSLKEDVVKGVKGDIEKIRKPATSKARGAAKTAVQGAASRAKYRMAGRAGLAGLALGAGAALGSRLSKSINVGGKKLSRTPSGRADKIPGPAMKGSTNTTAPKKAAPGAALKKAQDFVKGGGVFKGQKGEAKKKDSPPKPPEMTTRKKFSDAFGKARREGKKEFVFQGKRYNTKLKK